MRITGRVRASIVEIPRTGVAAMAGRWASLLLSCWVLMTSAGAAPPARLKIEHRPPDCVLAENFPRIEACVEPASDLARARVFFRAEGASYWSYAEMTQAGSCLGAVLPRPARSTHRIQYYVVAEDRSADEQETQQFKADVVDGPGSCRGGGVVAPLASVASVIVGRAPGAPAVPQGFARSGVSGAGMSKGLVAASVVGSGVAVAGLSTAMARGDAPTAVS